MSNSEPSAIVLHGIPCIGGLYKFRFEWRKRFAQGSPRFTLSRSRMRSRTGLASPVENQACGIAKYPRLRASGSPRVPSAPGTRKIFARDEGAQTMAAGRRRLVLNAGWRRFGGRGPGGKRGVRAATDGPIPPVQTGDPRAFHPGSQLWAALHSSRGCPCGARGALKDHYPPCRGHATRGEARPPAHPAGGRQGWCSAAANTVSASGTK